MVNAYTSLPATRTAVSPGVVQDYLDVLLRDVLPDDVPAAEPEIEWASDCVPEEPGTLAAAPLLREAVDDETVAQADMPTPVAAVAETPAQAVDQRRAQMPWADKPFASLLFDVMGLKLAAPLHELGGIMPLDDKLQPMAAQADWFMGLIRWNGRTIRVVDTARFVMPERVGSGQQADYQSVVVLGDSHWALAVNNADQSVNLQPADVRWRQTMGKRPWLAGTVLDRLCALLDVDVLVGLLDASDTARQVKADLAKENG
ncbi:MAG: chemotaxis protein CheW [Pseudohongiella sp.]|uniref:chemotaxis protein CheW n=1 Tax=Pseudohongiella sp. TaxID=1979412 RepID=UPI0034A0073E